MAALDGDVLIHKYELFNEMAVALAELQAGLRDGMTPKDILGMILEAEPVDPVKHGRWIPCEERMPEEPFGCLATVMDTEPMTGEDFENLYPYFVGWDGEQWNDCDGCQCPFEVLAWMPLPEPYKMDEEVEHGSARLRGTP